MDSKTTRRTNLLALIREAGTEAALARKTGASEKYISQIICGYQGKKDKAPRQVGDVLARKLEKGMNKPAGWMDVQHDDLLPPDIAAFLDQVQAEAAARDIPDHIMQSVLTLISSSPKKTN